MLIVNATEYRIIYSHGDDPVSFVFFVINVMIPLIIIVIVIVIISKTGDAGIVLIMTMRLTTIEAKGGKLHCYCYYSLKWRCDLDNGK